jgi:hypothetical protein
MHLGEEIEQKGKIETPPSPFSPLFLLAAHLAAPPPPLAQPSPLLLGRLSAAASRCVAPLAPLWPSSLAPHPSRRVWPSSPPPAQFALRPGRLPRVPSAPRTWAVMRRHPLVGPTRQPHPPPPQIASLSLSSTPTHVSLSLTQLVSLLHPPAARNPHSGAALAPAR